MVIPILQLFSRIKLAYKRCIFGIIYQKKMQQEVTKDILQWDVKSWSKVLTYWDTQIDWSKVENGLELGARQGGLSLWLALKGKNVICSDLENIEITAEQLHSQYNFKSLIQYQNIDATAIPYENYFDIIVFKSIIGGIGRTGDSEKQQLVFDQIYKALKPGGKLLFAENTIASPMHQFLRKSFTEWKDYWEYLSVQQIGQFLTSYSSAEIKTTGFLGTLGRNENQRSFFASLDNLFFNKVCPTNWKYIAFGIAEK
jgi:2-polyprenyl-3-methyl-5-hydroxy-6-metoxy-1,4-benzoquinol methylase